MTGDLEFSETDQVLLEEVRSSLAGLDSAKIPDDTIVQAKDRLVVPSLNGLRYYQDEDQEKFDNAVVFWTAEMAFNAWMAFTRLRDAEVEAYTNPDSYKAQLEKRTNFALTALDVTRPPEIQNQVITVAHDGVQRRVDLDQPWVPDDTEV